MPSAFGVPTRSVNRYATPAITLLTTLTASSSASLSYTGLSSASYKSYEFVFAGVIPSTQAEMYIEGSVNGGITYPATWRGTNYLVDNGPAFAVQVQTNTAAYRLAQSQQIGVEANGISGKLTLHYPPDKLVSSGQAQVVGTLGYRNMYSNYYLPAVTTIAWDSALELNAVRFAYGAGTIVTGTIKIYGIT